VNFVVQSGAKAASSVQDAAKGVEFVVTMLPVGANVRAVFLDEGVIAAADSGTVLIDSSTIDVDTVVPSTPLRPSTARRKPASWPWSWRVRSGGRNVHEGPHRSTASYQRLSRSGLVAG